MPAPEILRGARIVATPSALDAASWPSATAVLRIADDDALVLGLGAADVSGSVDDEHAIVADEVGFVGWWLTSDDVDRLTPRIEWALPRQRPALAQGLIAAVPCKLWLTDDRALVVCAAAHADELRVRVEELS